MTTLITLETIEKIKPGKKPPPSCVGWLDTIFGLAVAFAVFFRFKESTVSATDICIMMIGGAALILGYLEISRAPWLKTKPSTDPFMVIVKRAAIKWLGFWVGIGFIAFIYWVFPEYNRPFYKPFFETAYKILPWLPSLFAIYFLYAEWRFPEEKDGSWQAGLVALGRWREIDVKKLRMNALGWLVKAYFFPNMFCDMSSGIFRLKHMNWNFFDLPFFQQFTLVFLVATMFELVFVCAGYLFTSRFFNSHIRAVESTFFGWFIALMSYGPFNSLFYNRYFSYRQEGANWQNWLAGHETILMVWGSVVMGILLLHMWCDACFGLRFSNLTNRGIITNGPYRFSKHPAYVLKGIRWTMMSVPFFVGGSWDECLRLTLLLCGVHIIYYLRAMTEEKLLSQDPVYIEYGLWMDRHGLLAWVGKIIPHAKYETRLRKWVDKKELVRLENPVIKMDV